MRVNIEYVQTVNINKYIEVDTFEEAEAIADAMEEDTDLNIHVLSLEEC